jgi:hypothetical protein
MSAKAKAHDKQAVSYAIFLAGKRGITIPENSFGEIEWAKIGRRECAKSVTFKIPHEVRIDIPNWDWVPKKPQKSLL